MSDFMSKCLVLLFSGDGLCLNKVLTSPTLSKLLYFMHNRVMQFAMEVIHVILIKPVL